MSAAVLADFGSTICKVTLVNLDDARVLGHGEAPTFLGEDVSEAHEAAFDIAVAGLTTVPPLSVRLSASSAGGGLRIAAVGLVEEMTAAAAKRAALNAGGRLELVLHGMLDASHRAALDAVDPEIVLFGGGTDGGQSDQVVTNAQVLSSGSWSAHVIVACNRDVADDVAAVLRQSGRTVSVVDNVMPRVGEVSFEAARAEILSAFLSHVIQGKNLSRRPGFLDSVITATPEAVLSATRLMAHGTATSPGLGDVVVVDVGGATTDVHSVTPTVRPTRGRRGPLLPVSVDTRTVHGDLGMRSGALGAVEADRLWLVEQSRDGADCWDKEARYRAANPAWLATTPSQARREELLGTSCVTHSLTRHCGRQAWVFAKGDKSPRLTATGLDLRDVSVVVGTGGVIVHGDNPARVIDPALERAAGSCMSPRSPQVVIDRDYVIAAGGLLRRVDDDLALRMLVRALELRPGSPSTSYYSVSNEEEPS